MVFSWPWFAGFIDGEGCFVLAHTTKTTWSPNLRIGQQNTIILDYIKASIGSGSIPPSSIKHGNPTIVITRTGLERILPKILPFLKVKSIQAQLLLQACKLNDRIRHNPHQPEIVEECHKELKAIDMRLKLLKRAHY